MAERAVAPLRSALAERYRSPDMKAPLPAMALTGAERACALCPWDPSYPELVAQAHLFNAGGRRSHELEQAAAWYQRSLDLRPVGQSAYSTYADIERELSRGVMPQL
jgi:hypothetical protein